MEAAGSSVESVGRSFDSLADSFAQNDMRVGVVNPYAGVAKRRDGAQNDSGWFTCASLCRCVSVVRILQFADGVRLVGSVKENIAPLPGVLSAQMRP